MKKGGSEEGRERGRERRQVDSKEGRGKKKNTRKECEEKTGGRVEIDFFFAMLSLWCS